MAPCWTTPPWPASTAISPPIRTRGVSSRARASGGGRSVLPDLGAGRGQGRPSQDQHLAGDAGETLSIKGESYEFCHILDSVVELTEEGKAPLSCRKGDSFVMKPGFRSIWKTIETVRKIYVVIA